MDGPMKEHLAVGDRIPDLSLPAVDSGVVNLRDYRRRKLILFMWASW